MIALLLNVDVGFVILSRSHSTPINSRSGSQSTPNLLLANCHSNPDRSIQPPWQDSPCAKCYYLYNKHSSQAGKLDPNQLLNVLGRLPFLGFIFDSSWNVSLSPVIIRELTVPGVSHISRRRRHRPPHIYSGSFPLAAH
jgi:hypothetical protein